MKVKELIAKLQEFDEELEVWKNISSQEIENFDEETLNIKITLRKVELDKDSKQLFLV
jgi:hypothetical protein